MSDAKTVYLVRHGQTPWTAAERVQGWAPVPLNDAGREQVRATGNYLAEQLSEAEAVRIETSDLRRASESAAILADSIGDRASVNERERFRERDFGVLQGLDDVRYHRLKAAYTTDGPGSMLSAPERGESWREVETRTLEGWATVVDEMGPGETRVVVAHTGPMYCILAAASSRRLETEMDETDLPEASAFEIQLADDESRVEGVWTPE